MKIFVVALLVPLTFSACASSTFIKEELRLLKPVCTGGHWEVCSDIAHKVRQTRVERVYRAQ